MATVRVDAKDLSKWFENAYLKAKVLIRERADNGSKIFENYAKKNRRWTDRTGHARQLLKGYYEEVGEDKVRICISHGVEYGYWLEYAHERRYAILQETVDNNSAQIVRSFDKIWNALKV